MANGNIWDPWLQLPWKQAKREFKDLWTTSGTDSGVPFLGQSWKKARKGYKKLWQGMPLDRLVHEPQTFDFPTGGDIWKQISESTPFWQPQMDILGTMQSPDAFRQAVAPYMQDAFKMLGRRGLTSSSLADRVVADRLGSLWAQNQFNTLAGYQNMANAASPWMRSYWYPYSTLYGSVVG